MKTNKLRIWVTTSVILVFCVICAISVAMLVGCEKNEYDPSAPSPENTPEETNDVVIGFETNFVTNKLGAEEYPDESKEEDDTLPPETEDTETKEPKESESETEEEEEKDEPASQSSDWKLLLVNPWNPLPKDFSVDLLNLSNGHKVDARAYEDLQAMMDDCRAAGLSPYICSSYRTHDYQKGLHQRQINKYLSYGYSQEDAYAEASKWVAVAGTSEHQTGLALDIVASYYIVLDESQADMPEQKWLMENSYKYGWILRYPDDKSSITGIYYEPWHYRYVGKEAAKEIHDRGICLEEYLGK